MPLESGVKKYTIVYQPILRGHRFTHSVMRKSAPLPPKTPAQVRDEFTAAGVSISEWARAHGFQRMTVVDVLRGTRKGKRGEAHRVAVALGLKVGRLVDVKNFKAPPPVQPKGTT